MTADPLATLAADAQPTLDAAALSRLGVGTHLVGSPHTARKVFHGNTFSTCWLMTGMKATLDDEQMAAAIARGELGDDVQVWQPDAVPLTARTLDAIARAARDIATWRTDAVRRYVRAELYADEATAEARWAEWHDGAADLLRLTLTGGLR